MTLGIVELAPSGTCPLCQARLPEAPKPRRIGDSLAVLDRHFSTTCPVTAFTTPAPSK
jgi:hypothetical protein